MIGGSLLETESSSISIVGRISRYFLHGLLLGVACLVPLFLGVYTYTSYYMLAYTLLGPSFTLAIVYGVTFLLLGGLNQAMSKQLWGIETDSNLGTGMRDGFVLFMLFNIAYSPVMLLVTGLTQGFIYPPIPVFNAFLLFIISSSLYLFLFGYLGAMYSISSNVERAPAVPNDIQARTFKCPYCGSLYYYSSEKESRGQVECQNCARFFEVS
ncbi:MAG: hypothetical protein ACFFEK_06600 [Candidatus Thorarchaeota archaeon]